MPKKTDKMDKMMDMCEHCMHTGASPKGKVMALAMLIVGLLIIASTKWFNYIDPDIALLLLGLWFALKGIMKLARGMMMM